MHRSNRSSVTAPCIRTGLPLVMACILATAQGATVTWDASGDTNWTQPDGTSWSGGTYNSGDDAIFGNTGVGSVNFTGTLTPGSVTIGNTAGTYLFTGGGAIGGSGGLTMNGAGGTAQIDLTTVLGYSGNTTVTAGTLQLRRAGTQTTNLGSGNVIINGGTLALAGDTGTYTVGNNFTVNASGGTVDISRITNNPVWNLTGTLGLNGSLTLASGGGGPSTASTFFAGGIAVGTGAQLVNNIANNANQNLGAISGASGSSLTVQTLAAASRMFIPAGANSFAGTLNATGVANTTYNPRGLLFTTAPSSVFSSAQIKTANGGVLVLSNLAVSASDLSNVTPGVGGGLVITGASGSLTGYSGFMSKIGPGGALVLDNESAINSNRIADADPVALNSTRFVITGRNANDTPVNETVGDLSLAGGSILFLDRKNGDSTPPGSGVTLTTSTLPTPASGSSLLIQTGASNDFGDPVGAGVNALVVTGSKPGTTNGMITPRIQHYQGGNNLGDFLTFSGNNTIKATYTTYAGDFAAAGPTELVNYTAGTTTTLSGSGTLNIHALRMSSAGDLNLGGRTVALGSGGLIMTSRTISNGTLDFGVAGGVIGAYNSAAQATISGAIAVSGGLTVLGTTQTLNITNAGNTIAGGIFLNGGATRFAGTAANGNNVTVNGFGRLVAGASGGATDTIGGLSGTGLVSSWVANAGSAAGTLVLQPSSGTFQFDGLMINGNGSPRQLHVTKSGAGTQILTGDNTYTGITTVNGGVLSIPSIQNGSVASPLGASGLFAGNLVLGGGTLRFTGQNGVTDRGYTLTAASTGTFDVSSSTGTLTLNGGSAVTSGNLAKAGDGLLVLNAANNHTGFTRVSAGTLRAAVGGALSNTSPFDFAAGGGLATLDIAGLSRDLGQITNSGTGSNARIDNSSANAATLVVAPIFGTASVFDGQITQSGGGEVTLRVGHSSLVPASSLNLGGAGGNSFTGKVQIQPNATLIVSSGQESSLGLGTGADAIHLNGGTLRVENSNLTINDPGRDVLVDLGNIGLGYSGGTISVAAGRTLTIANTVQASGVALRKTDAGTLNLTGLTQAGSFNLLGGGVDITGGDFRVNSLQVSGGAFNWGNGRLSLLNRNGADGSTDYSSTIDPAGPEVRVGKAMTVTGNLTTAPGSILELHGSPTFYENANVRFNQLNLTGILDLSAAGDTLEVDITTSLLRGDTDIEYGSIPLITAGQIIGFFDVFATITSGGSFDQHTGAFTSASALPDDTWYLQYADTGDPDAFADTLYFHYRLTPTFVDGGWAGVPEPGTFSLAAAGVFALRLLRRSGGIGDAASDGESSSRKPRRRRRSNTGFVLQRRDSASRF